ncbi:MAG: polymer-forming cytoskeletal protein [Bacteroidia bacterium]|nr:polymer-forming cytoskeletal protein [Bacteroidia bacterium]
MAMFSNNTKTNVKENVELSSANTTVAKGAALTGDLETVGTIRIEGKIFGNVVSKSKTSLGESGYIEGNILAQNAEIAGEVKGIVKVVDVLTLKATAIIHGDIFCGKFVVEPGARFIGKCDMSQPVKSIEIEDKPRAIDWSENEPLSQSYLEDSDSLNHERSKSKKTTV